MFLIKYLVNIFIKHAKIRLFADDALLYIECDDVNEGCKLIIENDLLPEYLRKFMCKNSNKNEYNLRRKSLYDVPNFTKSYTQIAFFIKGSNYSMILRNIARRKRNQILIVVLLNLLKKFIFNHKSDGIYTFFIFL